MSDEQQPVEEKTPKAVLPGAMNDGTTLAINLVVSVLLSMAIGYGIDSVAGTKPLFMLLFMVLGFVAGIRKIMQAADTNDE